MDEGIDGEQSAKRRKVWKRNKSARRRKNVRRGRKENKLEKSRADCNV